MIIVVAFLEGYLNQKFHKGHKVAQEPQLDRIIVVRAHQGNSENF